MHTYLAILCDLFGMVNWPLQKINHLQIEKSKGHLELPGTKPVAVQTTLIYIFFRVCDLVPNTHSQFSTNLWNSTEVPNHHFSIQGVSTSHPVTVTTTSTISLAGGPVLIDLHVSLLLVMAPLDIPEYKEVSGIGKRLNISPLLGRG